MTHRLGTFLALTAISWSIASQAVAAELVSASYAIHGSNFSGGGYTAMSSTVPGGQIGTLGASIGQSDALGFSGSAFSLRTLAPGFWPIVGGGFPTLDSDSDLIAAWRDNCPFRSNPGQADVGGVMTLSPDGIGDACQCGDVDDDGVVDGLDVEVFRDSLADPANFGLTPEGVEKCSVIEGAGPCEVLDVTVISRALEPTPLLPGIDRVCAAASPP